MKKQEVIDKIQQAYNDIDGSISTIQGVLRELSDLRDDVLGSLPEEAKDIEDDEPSEDESSSDDKQEEKEE